MAEQRCHGTGIEYVRLLAGRDVDETISYDPDEGADAATLGFIDVLEQGLQAGSLGTVFGIDHTQAFIH